MKFKIHDFVIGMKIGANFSIDYLEIVTIYDHGGLLCRNLGRDANDKYVQVMVDQVEIILADPRTVVDRLPTRTVTATDARKSALEFDAAMESILSPPICACDCGAVKAKTTHANWCSTK